VFADDATQSKTKPAVGNIGSDRRREATHSRSKAAAAVPQDIRRISVWMDSLPATSRYDFATITDFPADPFSMGCRADE